MPDRWWRATDADIADALIEHAKGVETSQSGRVTNYKKALKLYQGRDVLPGRSVAYLATPTGDVLSLNVVASIIRSLRAKIVRNRPAPMILTDGASQEQQDQAKGLQSFVEGALYETGAYEAMEKAFDVASITGDAWIKVYPDFEDECIRVECRYPWEVFVSDQEGYRGQPRSIYERAHIDREVLHALYGDEHGEAILTASQSRGDEDFGFGDSQADQIEVWEGWRLPSSRKSEDGRHGIVLQGAALLSEPWTRERYPWAHFAIEAEPVGCHGTGICDELYGIQSEINNVLAKVQEGHQLGGSVMLLVEEGSSVNKGKLTNQGHVIVTYKGPQPPQPTIIPAVAPETYQYLWQLVDRAYAIYGVSQLSAQSVKPAGLNSGRALRTHHDLESERFAYIARAYERLVIDIAQLILDAAQDLAEQVPGYAVRYSTADSIKRIKWKEVDMDRDAFVMRVHPASFLPQTPGGKLAAVQDLVELQVVPPQEAARLLELPDAKSRPNPYESSMRLARYQVDRILRDGEPQTPESYQDLQVALNVALAAYCDARTFTDVEASNLDLLREYIEALQGLISPPPDPAAMPTPDAAMVPPVPPEAMPPVAVPPAPMGA